MFAHRPGATLTGNLEVVLRNGSLQATIVPAAAMLVTSLRHEGEELLGQRGDAETFVRTGKTTGSPLLYPWANRLSATHFEVAGKTVDASGARRDALGSPMHRLPQARHGWSAEPPEPDRIAAILNGTRPRSRSGTRCGSSTA
jgi:hypothetical protein